MQAIHLLSSWKSTGRRLKASSKQGSSHRPDLLRNRLPGKRRTRRCRGIHAKRSKNRALQIDVNLGFKTTGCHGYCENGPLVVLRPKDILYLKVKPKDVPEIVEKSIKGEPIIERLIYKDVNTKETIAEYHEHPLL